LIKGQVRANERPVTLDEEQGRFWRELVGNFPAGRFNAGDRPLLIELCRHQAVSRKVHEELEKMRWWVLSAETPHAAKRRGVFLQLLRMAREETKGPDVYVKMAGAWHERT
jgi:hypothetical protein